MQIKAEDSISRKIKAIFVNGVDVAKRSFYVDDIAEEVHCYKTNSEGNFYLEDGFAAKEILYGKVQIIFKEESN